MTTSALHPAPSPTLAPVASAGRSPWLDRTEYPFTPRPFDTPDGRMSYLDEGSGKPVFLVHGTPSWSFEWRHVVRSLAGERRLIAPDHLGFGLSEKPARAPYRVADHARRLLALFDALDLHDVTLVVHDFGGPIGLPIALERPSRVTRVVVVNSWMWPNGDDPATARLCRMVSGPVGRFLYRWMNASPRWLLPASFGDRKRLTPAVHSQYVGPFASREERTAPWVLGTELTGGDAHYASLWERRAALAQLPMTIVWGEKDPAFGAKALARWTEAFPHASVVRCPGAGHFPQEEDPDAVIRAVRG
jgi:haloalkane dehalogenase